MSLLEKILLLENEAAQFGFRWENTMQIMAQIHSECAEINEHLEQDMQANSAHLQEEIGDLLHAVFSLCVFCKFSPAETIEKTTDKFERRLNAVKEIAWGQGLSDLNGRAFDELMMIWQKAKAQVG